MDKVCRTVFGKGKSIYSNLWYCDTKNKVCMTFTPRGGCSISFQQYLDLVGLLEDGLQYNRFIHEYRNKVFTPTIPVRPIETLIQEKYTFVKYIMNPYIRAVSIFRAHTSHNLSFRAYLTALVHHKIELNANDKYHYHPQYIEGEETIITKYIKIDQNETFQITLADGTHYLLDVNRYSSIHHGKKNPMNTTFCGDLPLQTVRCNLPKSYKYFYDEEIRHLVETFYQKDIEHYGYSFDSEW